MLQELMACLDPHIPSKSEHEAQTTRDWVPLLTRVLLSFRVAESFQVAAATSVPIYNTHPWVLWAAQREYKEIVYIRDVGETKR